MQFLTAKLLDYAPELNALERSPNPFAVVVLAHLQALATRGDPPGRLEWKLRLARSLYERDWTAEDVRELFRIIDWILDLPDELQQVFRTDLHRFEEEKGMRYVTSIERLAREEGREEGREQGREEGREQGREQGLQEGIVLALETRFGSRARKLSTQVRQMRDLDALRRLTRSIQRAETLAEVRELLHGEG